MYCSNVLLTASRCEEEGPGGAAAAATARRRRRRARLPLLSLLPALGALLLLHAQCGLLAAALQGSLALAA